MAMSANPIGSWAYAVPLDESAGGVLPSSTRSPHSDFGRQSFHLPQDPRSSRRPRLTGGYTSDSDAGTGSRRPSMRSASATAVRKRPSQTLREKKSDTMMLATRKRDESQWIHRDKLAQIEIQEMEEAGFSVRQSRRSLSVGADGRDRLRQSMDRSQSAMGSEMYDTVGGDEQYRAGGVMSPDGSTRKRISTVHAADEEEQAYYERQMDSGVHTPEEQTSDHDYRGHHSRPSTSRIPVSKTSPAPVSQSVIERESPLTHSRNGSNSLDEMQIARRTRTNSIGSQVLLDDSDGRSSPQKTRSTTNDKSPNKANTPKGTAPRGRKASSTPTTTRRPSSSHKNRTPSTKPRQPSSTSGHKSRPSTSHKPPEGEAPWIATMYKPDPRLPPDQQMLPTHAKRLMQEQWEKEGKVGTTYDRDLRLLNDEEIQRPTKDQPVLEVPGRDTPPNKNRPVDSPNSPTWPLTPPGETRSDTSASGVRPSTSGGYKITPTIVAPPPGGAPGHISPSPSGHHAMSIPAPQRNLQSRMSDLTEKDEPTPKKFMCCTMM